MDSKLILDTTLLIDLEREGRRNEHGPAHAFLELHENNECCLTLITVGELFEGVRLEAKEITQELISQFEMLSLSQETSWIYGQESKRLRQSRERIGDNDLWIAAIALEHDCPVVTRNQEHFRRINGLRVLTY